MQLFSIGDAVINMDCVTAIDVDREKTGLTLKILTNDSKPVITFRINPDVYQSLMKLVPENMRFRGLETEP